jgi:hypothetical protein
MPFLSFRNAVFAAALSLTPTLSFAQEVFGNITANLDGEERTWFLTAQDNESQSFGLSIAVANMQSFQLWGQPSEDSAQIFEDSLLFTFDIMSVAGQLIPLNAEVIFLADGWKSGWIAGESYDEANDIVLSLTTLEKRDDGVFIEGSFEAAAHYREPLSSGEIDPSRTLQINGSFSAVFPAYILEKQ